MEKIFGAGNEARTRDLNLGKVALYQLSYSRKEDVIMPILCYESKFFIIKPYTSIGI